MKIFFALICMLTMSFTTWEPDFEKAKRIAAEKNELILLNFSGSDWCGPCIRMRNEIFNSGDFLKMADTNVVLVNADFPRNKKNQLPKILKTQNESLADKYNPQGKFPFTLLLTANGIIIKTWDGLPTKKAHDFTDEVNNICSANKIKKQP